MKRGHKLPFLSKECSGFYCRTCPRPWRFLVSGMELWGMGDNATWFDDATEDYRRRPVEVLSRARWRRVLFRWVTLVLPTLIAFVWGLAGSIRWGFGLFDAEPPGWTHAPWGWFFFTYISLTAATGAVFGGQALVAWWSVREVRRNYIMPAAKVLSKTTGVTMKRRDMLACIELPDNFGREIEGEPEPVRVYVPEVVLDDGAKKRIANAVGSRLGLPDPIAAWTESGVPVRYVELLPQALPPKRIELEDLMEELLASEMDNPLVGIMSAGRLSRMDMKNDSPHTLGSAGSGAGKSTLYKLIGMQRLRLGAYGIILDFKKWSHLRWAGRLPAGRVLIEDGIPEIHNALGRVLEELLWRKSFDLKDEARLGTLPVIDVYVEEINTLMDMLIDYWAAERARLKNEARTRLRRAREAVKAAGAEGEAPDALLEEVEKAEEQVGWANGLPTKSPAIQAIRYGVNLGREFRIHFHFIGQSIDAKAAGGRNTRESFKTRLLARWDLKTWKMLSDGLPYIACPSEDVGVWAHIHNGRADILRVPYVPDAFAVEYVLGGIRPSLPMFHDDPTPVIEEDASTPALAAAEPLSKILPLLPAKRDGNAMTLKALQLAAGRDGFPERQNEPEPGKAALYIPDEVIAWFHAREGGRSLGS